jgi:GT2 family glycosyltransferase
MHVTVVIPTYNRLELLRGAVEAVQSQSYDQFDLIIVDDGSGPDQRAWLQTLEERSPQVSVIFQENSGPAAARNRGWQAADGTVVAFTDDDCRPPRDWLARFVDAYRSHPTVGGVGSYIGPTPDVAARNPYARYHQYTNDLVYDMPDEPVVGGAELHVGGTGSMSYRRTVLEEVGGFDEDFPLAAGEDADLQERVAAAGYEFVLLPVKVEHAQTYSLRQFIEEAYRRGRGVYHFDQKHGGGRHLLRILIGLLAAPVGAVTVARRTGDPTLAALEPVSRALNRAGELAEWVRSRIRSS